MTGSPATISSPQNNLKKEYEEKTLDIPTSQKDMLFVAGLASAKKLKGHPFLTAFSRGLFSHTFAEKITAAQIQYNFDFLIALALLRKSLAPYPNFIVEFCDPHLASELGSSLPNHGLIQSGETHLAMIYRLADSLQMDQSARETSHASSKTFFQSGVLHLIGNDDPCVAIGALYADEVLAEVWFPAMHQGFLAFQQNHGVELDLEFFSSHADAIEPAHVEHADQILRFRAKNRLCMEKFQYGYNTFCNRLSDWFDQLHQDILCDSKQER